MAVQSLKIPSCTNNLCKLEEFVQSIAKRYGITEDKFPDILISLTEAVNNAIIHGNKKDISKLVEIQMSRTDDGLAFTVRDEGAGFNPAKVPDPTTAERRHHCGGRGVFLMKQLADDIRFRNNGSTVEIHFAV
ncbi:MAG: ATP-binding protein [Bacteroidota bacterium]